MKKFTILFCSKKFFSAYILINIKKKGLKIESYFKIFPRKNREKNCRRNFGQDGQFRRNQTSRPKTNYFKIQ